MYQKEAQVISIYSDQSQVYVSVPQLVPNFQTIGMDELQDISYQVRSFRFTNNFVNLLATDQIGVNVTIGWNQGNLSTGANPGASFIAAVVQEGITWLNLGYDSTQSFIQGGMILNNAIATSDKSIQASELVTILNQQLNLTAMIIIDDQASTILPNVGPPIQNVRPVTISQQNIVHFVKYAKLFFDDTTGKIGIASSVQEPLVPLPIYTPNLFIGEVQPVPLRAVPDDCYIAAAQIEFYTDFTASVKDQTRIARMLNLKPYPFNAFRGNPLDAAPYPLFYGTLATGPNEFWQTVQHYLGAQQNFAGNNQILFRQIQGFALTANQNLAYQTSIGSAFSIGDKPINVNLYDYIYIRTSLNTNFWDYTGKKSDVLDIIPVTKSMVEYGEFHTHITRIYQAKDPNVQNFQIRFTDKDNNPITFRDKYLLNLAVFYTPG